MWHSIVICVMHVEYLLNPKQMYFKPEKNLYLLLMVPCWDFAFSAH